jgi:hypothetical protein
MRCHDEVHDPVGREAQMIDGIIRWSLVNRVAVLAAAALLLGWGGYEAARMPIDVLRELVFPLPEKT